MRNLDLHLIMRRIGIHWFSQELRQVSYFDELQKLNGLITSNVGKRLPGVLILPAWKGIDDEARTAALNLQKEGYMAFIADIYGEGNIPADNASASRAASKLKSDYRKYQRRIRLALEQLKKAGADAERLAIIGFCFGGTGALEAARSNFPVVGVVCIHGGLGKDARRYNGEIEPKILIEHPIEDRTVTPQHMVNLIKEMNTGQADWHIISYAYCKHTFTDPKSNDYNEVMAKRAWQHTLLFLKEILAKKEEGFNSFRSSRAFLPKPVIPLTGFDDY